MDGIGIRCAYFKMEKINLASLRQCLLDPDVRILQEFEYESFHYPRIASISLECGFFDGESAVFNEGLNSILGGKGTGKSLLIEFLRFALDQSPELEQIKSDHENKLKHRLGDFGIVRVEFVDETGTVCEIKRILDPSSTGYEEIEYDPSQVFPVLFLSQNEIIRIAEDEDLQLNFIDRFFSSKEFEERKNALEGSLHELDKQLADGLRAIDNVAELKESIATVQVELNRLGTKLDAPIFRQYEITDEKRQEIQTHFEHLNNFQLSTTVFREQIDSLVVSDLPVAHANDDLLTANKERLDKAKEYVNLQINRIEARLADVESLLTTDKEKLDLSFTQTREEYLEYVRGEGGDHSELTSERELLSQRLKRLKSRLETRLQVADSIAEISKRRELNLDQLTNVYEEWHNARMERCQHFQNSSDDKLKMNVFGLSDKANFRLRLLELKIGSNIRDTDIEKLALADQPRTFVQALLDYQAERANPSSETTVPLTEVAQNANIPLDRVVRLAEFLLNREKLEQLLELQYKAHPKDRPEIRFRVGKDKYELLDSLSVGQKCTALLIMTLTDGAMPVVIDQPEDSLDIRSIWDDICAKVREKKNQRQFIFTTHNSSVAVASDSDNFIILEADSDRGRVVFSGSMDSKSIGDEVLRYLEGGADPYRRKFLKYRAEHHVGSL